MKLVIDIPEEIYNYIQTEGYDEHLDRRFDYQIRFAVKDGTPHPKIGKWILSGGYWRCSECKEKALLKLDKAKGNCKEYVPVRSIFCPNCGVRMEGEV